MANKVKILDGQGTQVFPYTHTTAVLDNNGNSVEQSLGVLHDLYEALTQSNIVVVASEDWPLAELEERTIYRVAGTTSYTDYMYDGTEAVPMATYDNAIDDVPITDSDNLVKSGGVAAKCTIYDSELEITQSVVSVSSAASYDNSEGKSWYVNNSTNVLGSYNYADNTNNDLLAVKVYPVSASTKYTILIPKTTNVYPTGKRCVGFALTKTATTGIQATDGSTHTGSSVTVIYTPSTDGYIYVSYVSRTKDGQTIYDEPTVSYTETTSIIPTIKQRITANEGNITVLNGKVAVIEEGDAVRDDEQDKLIKHVGEEAFFESVALNGTGESLTYQFFLDEDGNKIPISKGYNYKLVLHGNGATYAGQTDDAYAFFQIVQSTEDVANKVLGSLSNTTMTTLNDFEFSWDAEYDGFLKFAIRAQTTDEITASLKRNLLRTSLEHRVQVLEGVALSEAGIVTLNNPQETILKFKQIKKAIRNNSGTDTQLRQLVLLHFSDIHGKSDNLQRIIEYYKAYQDYIDDVLHTGDNVGTQWSDSFTYWSENEDAANILNCIGNHDTATFSNGTYNWYAHVGNDAYDKFIAPFVSEWNVEQPDNAAADGKCYYYKDYDNSNVRMIVTDVMSIANDGDSAQLVWLEDVLDDAITQGLHVIGVCHYAKIDTAISCAFQNLYRKDSIDDMPVALINKIDTFIENGGKFVCWITGHSHRDHFGTFTGPTYGHKIATIVVDTAAATSQPLFSDISRDANTKGYDLFNIFSVDTYRQRFSIFRVGADFDSVLHHIGTITYDYENSVLMSSF